MVKGKRVIGYDNAEGKGDHRHYEDKEEVYTFKNVDKLFEDFYNDIRRVKKHEDCLDGGQGRSVLVWLDRRGAPHTPPGQS